jgi:hypothetical protein
MSRIEFFVSYGIAEYLQIVRELARPSYDEEIRKRGKEPTKLDSFLFGLLHTCLMVPIFIWKKIRVGRCRFTLDSDGVTRFANDGQA